MLAMRVDLPPNLTSNHVAIDNYIGSSLKKRDRSKHWDNHTQCIFFQVS